MIPYSLLINAVRRRSKLLLFSFASCSHPLIEFRLSINFKFIHSFILCERRTSAARHTCGWKPILAFNAQKQRPARHTTETIINFFLTFPSAIRCFVSEMLKQGLVTFPHAAHRHVTIVAWSRILNGLMDEWRWFPHENRIEKGTHTRTQLD